MVSSRHELIGMNQRKKWGGQKEMGYSEYMHD